MRVTVYVGTYTEDILFGTGAVLKGKGEGIYIFSLNPETGELRHLKTEWGVANPSYLAFSPGNRFLYAVNELKEYEGKTSGAVSAFSVDPESGGLVFLNRRPTGGTDPCHACVNDEGSHVFVSNFMSGSVCVFPLMGDGSLGEASDFIQHAGSSVDPRRQRGPHAHSLTLDGSSRFAFVPDLGIDKVMVYKFDRSSGRLLPNKPASIDAAPGSGPRHLEFHPNGRFAYLINELSSSITAFSYDGRSGAMLEIGTAPTVPAGYSGQNTCADVHIAPSGRFLYGSNRGHDSIVIYAIEESTGRLSPAGHEPTGGKTPRNFAVDPSGNFLLAANQDSDTIVTFRIDPASGRLRKVHSVEVPTPVCVKFYS